MTRDQRLLSSRSFSSSNLETSIRKLLNDGNIAIHNQSADEATIYCPFHKNTHSPALYINLKTGLWQCFNPSCDRRGNFRQLYKHITGKSFGGDFVIDPINLKYQIDQALNPVKEVEITLDSIKVDYGPRGIGVLQPLIDRGFTAETLKYLEIGFSSVKGRIVIPVRDPQFKIVGLIGRAVTADQEPRYLYNSGFKRANVLFNIQNAKMFNECIVVEGSLDCAKVVQSGLKNCVATLGAQVSPNQAKMLSKYFDKIIIFSDKDEAGDAMKSAIIRSCEGKALFSMAISDHAKDPGDMSVQEIQQAYKEKQTIIGGW